MKSLLKLADVFRHCRGGQIAIVTAIAAPVVVAGGGLGAESGYWYYKQRALQMSADLAAYAGAVESRADADATGIEDGATTEAVAHGYDPSLGAIAVNSPPLSGDNIDDRAVEVILDQAYPRFFSALLMEGDVPVSVRAVARWEDGGEACMLALDPEAGDALSVTGSADVSLTGCEMMSNSLSNDALSVSGAGRTTASCVNAVGGVSAPGDLTLTECGAPREGMAPARDPYADLEPPDVSGCRNVPGGGNGVRTIQPGRHCSGMTLNGEVHFSPGVYVVDGGDFRTNGNSVVTGEDVTIILTGGADLQMNGNADIRLSAPESGDYAGLLFWGDAADGDLGEITLNGTADSALIGAVYFPERAIDIRGNFAGSGGCTRLIGRTIELSGSASFDADCSAAGIGTVALPGSVRLVE